MADVQPNGINSGNGGSLPVFAESYGALGDGVTDDTAALQAAFNTGRDVALQDGKTYLHRQVLTMATAGQNLDGRGSTLKRAAQVVTTTTTTITSGGTTSITLASVAGLVVGDQIVIEQGGVYDATQKTIQSIVGNVVTVTVAFGQSFSGTTNVRTGWNQIAVTAADCRITNTIMDGNSSNWSWGRWNHQIAINCNGAAARILVDHCKILNQYGDGFAPSSAGWTFLANDVETLKGRGLVFSGNTGQVSNLDTRVAFNRFINCNLDTAVGASDGLGTINFSQGGPATVIVGNFIDGGQTGIGAIHSFNSGELTIADNEFWNLASWAIDGAGGGTQSASDVLVIGNRCYGCGISVDNQGNAGVANRWKIQNNLVVGAGCVLRNVTESAFQNNHVAGEALGAPNSVTATAGTGGSMGANTYFYRITATNSAGESTGSTEVSAVVGASGSVALYWKLVPGATGYKVYRSTTTGVYTTPALIATLTSGTTFTYTDTAAAASAGALPSTDTTMLITTTLLYVGGTNGAVTNSLVSGNQFYGGQYGVRIDSSVTNLKIDGNILYGQYTIGVYYSSTTGVSGIDILNNVVTGTAASASGTYIGLSISGGPVVRGNRVDWSAVTAGTGGIVVAAAGADAIIEENWCNGGGHSTVIQVQSGAARTLVRHNRLDHALGDSGTNTIKTGNRFTTGPLLGRAVLVAGTVTVSTAEVVASDSIQLTNVLAGGTLGSLSIGTIVAGTSFVINSSNAADTSTIYWKIDH